MALKEARRRGIRKALSNVDRAKTTLANAENGLVAELLEASVEGASYADLGEELGVTRQRVGQIIDKARKQS